MLFQIAVSLEEVKVAGEATVEKFKGLFIAKESGDEFGYGIEGEVLNLKYEVLDDVRVMVDPNKDAMANGYVIPLPRFLARLVAYHNAKYVRIGKDLIDVDVIVNKPDDEFIAIRNKDGFVESHQVDGSFFKKEGMTVKRIEPEEVRVVVRKYSGMGLGGLIPDEYLVRVGAVGDYVHLKDVCRDSAVAESFNKHIPSEKWDELKLKVSKEIDHASLP